MKRSGVLLAVLLFALAHAETYLGFENRAAGFGIAYPKNWTFIENDTRTMLVMHEKNKNLPTRPTFTVSSGRAAPGVKLDDYDRLLPRLLAFLFDDYQQHLKQPTTLGGAPARMLLFEAKVQKVPMVGFTVYALRNGQAYSVTFASTREDYERYRQVGGNILSTFRFL
jgi:hypothetical protein